MRSLISPAVCFVPRSHRDGGNGTAKMVGQWRHLVKMTMTSKKKPSWTIIKWLTALRRSRGTHGSERHNPEVGKRPRFLCSRIFWLRWCLHKFRSIIPAYSLHCYNPTVCSVPCSYQGNRNKTGKWRHLLKIETSKKKQSWTISKRLTTLVTTHPNLGLNINNTRTGKEANICCGVSQIFMICNSDARLRRHLPLEGFQIMHSSHACSAMN